MSADNGIYILELKDQSRVIHAQNIENLYWSYITMSQTSDFVPTRIIEHYKDAKPMSLEEARNKAFEMADEILNDDFCPILEYGIQSFKIDKFWNQILMEAKELAVKEIKIIKSWADWTKHLDVRKGEIKRLEGVLAEKEYDQYLN